MKKIIKVFLMLQLILVFSLALTSCGLLEGIFGSNSNGSDKYDDELVSSTGKWYMMGEDLTYFTFDGTKGKMTFSYYDNGLLKYSGTFRVVYRGNGEEVSTPLTFIFTRSDKEKEDWLGCYVDNFDNDFTQFTIMQIEEDLGFIDGTVHTHIYRISELPYKMGTYVLEGNEYKEEANNYKCANQYYLPSGTYTLETGESFTFLTTKPTNQQLFQYKNKDIVIEGTITYAQDKKTIYLYIEHDPYEKITQEDKKNYDTTFSMYYPADFYLRGDFSNSDYFVINDLYHHTYSPTNIKDSDWVFGTYRK